MLADIRREGAHVIHSYWSSAQCARVRDEIDRLLDVHRGALWIDAAGSDHRMFGADRVSPSIAGFYDDEFCGRIVRSYERSTNVSGFTLAARLDYREANPGSGGGWHRDRSDRRQTKAILYLSDVDETLGPFQYLAGSHRPIRIIRDVLRENLDLDQTRFEDDRIQAAIARHPEWLRTMTARAGTLMLVDTRAIHRGMPMTRAGGVRYALTNYYWTDAPIPEHIARLLVGNTSQPAAFAT